MSNRAPLPVHSPQGSEGGGKAWPSPGLLPPWVAASLGVLLLAGAAMAQTNIAATKHNLTPSGPGTLKTGSPAGLCVFCHTPHNANPTRALWNRSLPPTTYVLYSSTTLEATLNQPTGATRLCLSCHDGTLAMALVRNPRGANYNIGPLTGKAKLGTDLSDDHPVSFVYDSALALRRGQIVDPSQIRPPIKLDDTQQVQCTSCHDPHQDQNPKFLRRDNRYGAVCTSCHKPTNWEGSTHSRSTATWNGVGTSPWPPDYFPTVAENACLNCHRPHSAPRPQRLLANSQERAVCLICHNGTVAARNIEAEFLKPFHHPMESAEWAHDPKENPLAMTRHVICMDCHNQHQVTNVTANPPVASGRLRGVKGVNIGGTVVDPVNFQYEVCLKCHGVTDQTTPGPVRLDNTRNIRLKINPANPSYHPIAAVGKHSTIVDLNPPYTASSMIYCTDCHNNEAWSPTGTRPSGPHGSVYQPILVLEFQMSDPNSESPSVYALCYSCHNRSVLLNGQIRFPHEKHIVEKQASCAVCHDAHGSRQNIRLINFMLRDRTGKVVVSPNSKGLIQYQSTGPGQGNCSLSCHGKDHDQLNY